MSCILIVVMVHDRRKKGERGGERGRKERKRGRVRERGRKGREERRRGREGEMMEARVKSNRPRVGMASISQEGPADLLGHSFWSFSP